MKRREFITLLGGAAGWPLAARAQQPAMPVIGYLSMRSAKSDLPMLTAFRQGLNETGFVEGKNVTIEYRWGDGQYDRLPALAANLVGQRVAVIVTSGGGPAALAAKTATTEIPVVFNVGGEDPVRAGLIASINRPGGNLTGVTSLLENLGAKQLGLLHELVPRAITIAMLVNPNDTWAETQIAHTQAAARELGQELIVLNASSEGEINAAFATMSSRRAGALLVVASPLFVTRADHLVALSAGHALPAIYFRRELADAGGLMSYGSSTTEMYGQMGIYTGKILKGAKPADLPVMQPTKFEFVINLKTARTLGLTFPPGLLAIADQVVE